MVERTQDLPFTVDTANARNFDSVDSPWFTRNANQRMGMKVKRIVTDIGARDPAAAKRFYQEVLGLDLLMDMGWIATYGSDEMMSVQISFMREGGSGAPVPDLSIEVDDLDAAIARVKQAKLPIEYGPVREPWGVRRFFVRDPFGKLVNILAHDP